MTTQVISRQHKFLNSIHTVSIQNLKPVDSLIQVPNSNQTTTIAKMILSITDNTNERVFHAAVPSGYRKDQIILASTSHHLPRIRSVKGNVLESLQQSFPWLQESDILTKPEEPTSLMKELNELNISQSVQAGQIIDALFLDWEDFPSLSNNEDSATGLDSQHLSQGSWSNGPPQSKSHPLCSGKKSRHAMHSAKEKQGGFPIHNSVTVTLVIVPIVIAPAAVDAGQQSSIKPLPN